MANIFYNPSGNPGTGAEGLSAVMRAEFVSIGAGFDLVPQIGTTGAFSTIFNQQGSFTFTLPDASGTLALTTDLSGSVAVETTRAEAAEAANAASITAEAAARVAAVAANATAIAANTTAIAANATAITTETTRAVVAEAALVSGKNLLDNGNFVIQQRGPGPFTTPVYTADRWALSFFGDTASFLVAEFSPLGALALPGVTSYMAMTTTGTSGSNHATALTQRIEDVTRLAGQTVTLSFWASVPSGSIAALGIAFQQNFGTGGSPAPNVIVTGGKIALAGGTNWTRYSLTVTLPAVTGATMGTAGILTTYTEVDFFTSVGGSPWTIPTGGLGVQSGAVHITGIQLEFGAVMTSLEPWNPAVAVSRSFRCYEAQQIVLAGYNSVSGSPVFGPTVFFITSMRATPTVTITPSGGSGYASVVVGNVTPTSITLQVTSAAAGNYAFALAYTASADL